MDEEKGKLHPKLIEMLWNETKSRFEDFLILLSNDIDKTDFDKINNKMEELKKSVEEVIKK